MQGKGIAYLREAVLFAPVYVALDWLSYIGPIGPFNITPWNPPPALAIVWMMARGAPCIPAVFLTIVLADVAIRGVPGGAEVTVLSALVLTAGYAGLAYLLRTLLRPRPTLATLRQLTFFTCAVVPATAAIAGAFIGVLTSLGHLARSVAGEAWLLFWVGDAVGTLVTAPLLLVALDPERRAELLRLASRGEAWIQVVVLVATLLLVFSGLGGDPTHQAYLLFFPLIWIAVRSGMAGAIVALAIIQVGVVIGVQGQPGASFPSLELQPMVAGLALTGLYLGVMLDERERAAEGLKQSLRLAAAGEMAGAIAHEVNQPLTALINYGRSAQALLHAGKTEPLDPVLEKILGEAQRASEVVKRLRDFFREGSTRLEPTRPAELLEAGRKIAASIKAASQISFAFEEEPGLAEVLVDRLQMEVVLRNLLANAVEAIDGHAKGAGRITVRARQHDARHLGIVVADSGPGIPQSTGERVFEPFFSRKPTGMGLGLAVSRAIAEAHGGTLDARFGAHGEFRLVLPFEPVHG